MGMYTEAGAPVWHNAPSHVRMAVEMAFGHSKEKEVNLTKLALYFSASCPHADLTIVSVSSEEHLLENVEWISSGLSDHEKQVLKEIRNL